jgi:peptidoglycan/xylan/chitin deacetylase (PgdA/CDA1 family)
VHRGRCFDRAPQRNSGATRIYPLQRVGCGGFSESKVYNGSRKRKEVALTFDDGPGDATSGILKVLEDHHVHATFFEIGEQVPARKSLLRKIIADGDEIGNHSTHHDAGPGKEDMKETNHLIEGASGFRPCMFRPPGGYLPSSTLEAAKALHMVSVLWDVDTEDWKRPGSDAIYERATAVQRGSIVLMHDGGGDRSQTLDALPRIIENLRSRGYRLVTMTHMLNGRYHLAEVHGSHHG